MIEKNITKHPDVCFFLFLGDHGGSLKQSRPFVTSRCRKPGANAIHRVELEAVEKEPQVAHWNLKKLRRSNFQRDDKMGRLGK